MSINNFERVESGIISIKVSPDTISALPQSYFSAFSKLVVNSIAISFLSILSMIYLI